MDRHWFSNATPEQIFHVLSVFLDEIRKTTSADAHPQPAAGQGDQPPSKKTKPAGPVQRLIKRLKDEGWLAAQKPPWPDEGLRERIYPLIWKAIALNQMILQPPRSEELAQSIKHWYRLPEKENVVVVLVRGQNAIEHVTRVAAETVLGLIRELREKKSVGERTHVAWGAGTTSRLVARHLSEYLEREEVYPPLTLHALTSGFLPDPMTSPLSFMSFFDRDRFPIESVGLFSQAVVKCSEYEGVKDAIGVKKSFAEKGKIEIVISSLASQEDPNSLFNTFLADYQEEEPAAHAALRDYLHECGWHGDAQYLPYSAEGPIPLGKDQPGVRAVTLFELDELAERIRQGRRLVLVAAPRRDGLTRAKALVPLLRSPALKIWSHLILDVHTAEELVEYGKRTQNESAS